MLDLIKNKAPSSIELEGVFYDILTDFRKWLVFSKLLKEGAPLEAFNFLYVYKIPKDLQKGFEKLLEFFNPPHLLPRQVGKINHTRVLDYELDADLIYAAFMEVYKIDLFATDGRGHLTEIHWYNFMALISGLHGTRLNEVMSYRAYDPNDKRTHDKISKELKMTWALPEIETAKDRKAREEFNALFTK